MSGQKLCAKNRRVRKEKYRTDIFDGEDVILELFDEISEVFYLEDFIIGDKTPEGIKIVDPRVYRRSGKGAFYTTDGIRNYSKDKVLEEIKNGYKNGCYIIFHGYYRDLFEEMEAPYLMSITEMKRKRRIKK